MADDYMLTLVEVTVPRIIQGTRGRVNLRISDLNGEDVDLNEFDSITLILKNWPEKDETINRVCSVDATDSSKCYFNFTETESSGWLASPYFAQFTFIFYTRDSEVVDTSTGYNPELSTMNIMTCTFDFEVGEVITGTDSGDTATVYSFESFGGGLGELTLVNATGNFTDDEEITSPGGGAAVVVVGIADSEYMGDRFADDSSDFVALEVKEGDVLEIGTTRYVVSGYDSVVETWLTLEESVETPGTGTEYIIYTYDPDTSAKEVLSKTLEFALYVEDSLS